MGKFKVGDKVVLKESSVFNNGSRSNPLCTCGVITEVLHANGLSIDVDWDNGTNNAYKPEDLDLHKFTKSDLKDGMRLTDREGDIYYVCGNRWVWERCGGYLTTDCYNDNLIERFDNSDLDIMKVTDRDGTMLFEREEEPRELTIEEIAEAFNLPVERVRIKN